MPPNTQNPLIIAAYVVGIMLSLPVIFALIKLIAFMVTATNKLDSLVTDVAQVKKDVGSMRRSADSEAQATEISFFVLETDVNALQEKAGLARREYPDRRVGPLDRRATG